MKSNSILQLPQSERPREKLLCRGEQSCNEEELLAVILRSGIQGCSALDLARRLLLEFGGFSKLQQVCAAELKKIKGLGESRAAALLAAFAIARRLDRESWEPGTEFISSKQVFQSFQSRFLGLRKERFYALLLNGKNRLLKEELISEGTLTASLVHPREVFAPAIREAAASLIVLHNHPSGDPHPSHEDREVTRRLKQAGEIVGIPLLDHLVIGKNGYFSFLEEKKL